ncbi:hypothetical protein ACQ3I4_10375 [Zafaria sp. Z1313]|uniref:hypothetical protein n=1 Tax=unclassified Zafaria TaxID=2828765 RepID=UPI002E76CE88|nr:hypothetical protein [Zafaria sp. J156]MEE1620590.1 hypothetical protein [Zafaria sp. J156]
MNDYTSPEDTQRQDPGQEEVRLPVGTLVFGLVVVAIGLLMLVSLLYSFTLDPAITIVSLVVGAGLLLVIGGIASGRRRQRG